MASVEVILPGLLTTIQDRGRTGHAHEGFPECGAMDSFYSEIANTLVGNDGRAAVLECTAIGPKLKIHGRVLVAVSSNARVSINGNPNESAMPLYLHEGDELQLTDITGFRAYIAFHGGIDVPLVMGSRSTDLKTEIGGLDGRRLKKGDILRIQKDCSWLKAFLLRRHACKASIPLHPWKQERPAVIRVTQGPQYGMFTKQGIETFLSGTYTIATDSNRMGLRLEGPQIESLDGHTDILSDAILNGSIQIAASGLPIIMTADHQTTGGYAKIAVVLPSDLPVLAQLKPGDMLQFQQISESEALQLYLEHRNALKGFRKDMGL